MSGHHHGHGHCDDESHDHDHDHGDAPGTFGPQDNLFSRIDTGNVVALNTEDDGKKVIKPWDQRLDETSYIESDADDQIIIRIPFTGNVNLRALLLKAGPADLTPRLIALYPNQENLDFSDVEGRPAAQTFDVPVGREVGEYSVMRANLERLIMDDPLFQAKFTNATSITLYVPASQGADVTRIYYIGFLGQWSERKGAPVGLLYEASPNPADHTKVQGTEANYSTPTS